MKPRPAAPLVEHCERCSSPARRVYHQAGACPKPQHVGLIRVAAGRAATDRARGLIRR